MEEIALLLAAAAAGQVAARGTGTPVIPWLLLAGVGLSLLHPPGAGTLEDLLVLGATFLLFVAGLELDPRRLRAQARPAVVVGLAQFSALAALGYGLSRILGLSAVESVYVALALTASSTLVCVRLLQRRRELFDPYGRLVLGVLLLQDALLVLTVPFLEVLERGPAAALGPGAGILLLGALCLGLRRWAAPPLLRLADDEERLLLTSVTLLFAFLGLATVLGVPIVVGAFLAGAALARFPLNGVLRPELVPIGDFFTAIFLVALGAIVGVPEPARLLQAGALLLLLLAFTPPIVAVVAERAGLAARPSIEAGLLLSQASEFSLVIGLTGMLQGAIEAPVFSVIALVTLGSMLLTPLIATEDVAWWLVRFHPSRRRRQEEPPLPASDFVLLLGAGSTATPLLEELLVNGTPVVVVDDDPRAVARVSEAGVPALRGDGSEPAVLRRAGVDRARAVVSTLRRPGDSATVLSMAPEKVPVLVRVFEESDARRIESLGGVPILASRAAARAFLEWLDGSVPGLRVRLADRLGRTGAPDPRASGSRRSDGDSTGGQTPAAPAAS